MRTDTVPLVKMRIRKTLSIEEVYQQERDATSLLKIWKARSSTRRMLLNQ